MEEENKLEANTTYIDERGQKQPGTTAQTTDYWTNQANYYQKAYDDAVAANNKAAQAAAQQALDSTNRQIEKLNQQYQGTNEELYRNYMNSQKNLEQQMAARGYTGGIAESSRLGLDAGYANALRANEQGKADNLTALNAAYTDAQYQAQAAADQANAAALQTLYGNQAQLEANKYAEAQQRLQNQAQVLAASGDFSGYLNLGYTQAQVDNMTRMWLAENPAYKNTWAAAHPEDALRLGVTKPKANGSYSAARNTAPVDDQTIADSKDVRDAISNGSLSTEQVNAATAAAVKNGDMSQQQANYINQAASYAARGAGGSGNNGNNGSNNAGTTGNRMFAGTSWEFNY